MFGMRVRTPEKIKQVAKPFQDRLSKRVEIEPSTFHELVNDREKKKVTPDHLRVYPGTFVRASIDTLGRRSYRRVGLSMMHTLARRIPFL